VRGVIKDASLGTIDLENCEFSMKDPAAAAPPPQRTPVERERGCAVCVPDEPLTKPAPPSVPETPSPPQPPPEALPGSMPSAEQALVSAVQAARQAYESATNDLLKGTARVQRGKGICQAIPDRRAIHWVGKVSELSSNGEGKGVLAIEIAEGIHAKTWNNALSDMLDDTLIGPSSPVFQQVQSLTVGARVQFSGVFPASDTDCIRESSLTLGGSISEPDFIIKFTEIVPMEPTNNAVVGPMPAENNPPMVKATVDPNMTNAKRDALVARGCNFFLDGSYVCAQEATLPPDLAPNSGLKPPAVSNDSSVRGDQLGVNAPPVDAPIPPSRAKPRSAPEHAPPDPTASGLY